MTINSKKWLRELRASDDSVHHLLCIPFAGGGASVFRSWPQQLPESIAVTAVQLPGREDRYREPALTSLREIVDTLVTTSRSWSMRPYSIFGHSMGGLIAFELTRRLRELSAPLPHTLFVSARRAPQQPPVRKNLHQLSDEDFIAGLREYDGTPEAALKDRELMEICLPFLRADFSVLETYHYAEQEPLAVPIIALAGRQDRDCSAEEMRAWQLHTSARFKLHEFDGGHFFLQTHQREVTKLLAASLL
ncbi:MAG: alpha/beta fold hydrolase [Myxococcota bacterium]